MNSQETNKFLVKMENLQPIGTVSSSQLESLQERAQRQIEHFQMNSIQPVGRYSSLENGKVQVNNMRPNFQTNLQTNFQPNFQTNLQTNFQPISQTNFQTNEVFQPRGMFQNNVQANPQIQQGFHPHMINLQNRMGSNFIPEQIPNPIQQFNQEYLDVQKQFNQMMDNKFKVDSSGRIVKKPFQCNQCLTLCNFESVLKTHQEWCTKFSCDFLECRDGNFSTMYVSNEEFKSKENLEIHIQDKHKQILNIDETKTTEETKITDQNKFKDQNIAVENNCIVMDE